MIGTAMWWPYGPDDGTIGMVLVQAQVQRRGIGRKLMDAVLSEAGARRLYLNSTEAGTALYRTLKFVPCGGLRQIQGFATGASHARQPFMRVAVKRDLALLATVDRKATGMDRTGLLDELLSTGRGLVLEEQNSITGFGFVRDFGKGQLIGPVVCHTDGRAQSLIAAFLAETRGFVRIDCDLAYTELTDWLLTHGLTDSGTAIRMARGLLKEPHRTIKQYAVASQALG